MQQEKYIEELNGFEVHNPLNLINIQIQKRNNMIKDYIKLQLNKKNFYNYNLLTTYNLHYEEKEQFGVKGYQYQIPKGDFTDYLLAHFNESDCFLRNQEIFKGSTQIWEQNNTIYITIG